MRREHESHEDGSPRGGGDARYLPNCRGAANPDSAAEFPARHPGGHLPQGHGELSAGGGHKWLSIDARMPPIPEASLRNGYDSSCFFVTRAAACSSRAFLPVFSWHAFSIPFSAW